jgi:hypothetical protein
VKTKCSSRSNPSLFASWRSLASRSVTKSLSTVTSSLSVYRKKGAWNTFPASVRYVASVFPTWWEILPAEDCFQHSREKGYPGLR